MINFFKRNNNTNGDISFIRSSFKVSSSAQLNSKSEIILATSDIKKWGLISHHDVSKNWDCSRVLSGIILENLGGQSVKILDAGSGKKPVVNSWLRILDNENRYELHACDYEPKKSKFMKKYGIEFKECDISETPYSDLYFDSIYSVSCVEHGVDLNIFFREMSRIIKDNGYLHISTDYWPNKIRTEHKFPYGKHLPPMKVFSSDELKELIFLASLAGFELEDSGNLFDDIKDKVVSWDRMEESYTFVYLRFKKTGGVIENYKNLMEKLLTKSNATSFALNLLETQFQPGGVLKTNFHEGIAQSFLRQKRYMVNAPITKVDRDEEDVFLNGYLRKFGSPESQNRGSLSLILSSLLTTGDVLGNICEVGVYKGQTLRFICQAVEAFSPKQKAKVIGIDLFTGHSKRDITDFDSHMPGDFDDTSFVTVSNSLSEFKFCKLLKKRFAEAKDDLANDKFKFVHLDTDLYKPTLDGLIFFATRTNRGGVIIVDDYLSTKTPGIKKAIDDFQSLSESDFFYFVPVRFSCQMVLIKK